MLHFTLSPGAKFTKYDLVRSLFLLEKHPCGRGKLGTLLKLSEASTRSLMSKLKDLGYASDSTRGLVLTNRGMHISSQLHGKVSGPIPITNFEQKSVAFLVVGDSEKIKLGLEERDTAVRAGALGALIIVCEKGVLEMPGTKGFEKENTALFNELTEKLKPVHGDVIILAFARSEKVAGAGAWAAVETLI